jgi:hypothetical protein
MGAFTVPAAARLRAGWVLVRSAPRRAVAVGCGAAALLLAPVGFMMVLPAGLAVLSTAGTLLAAALLLGWNH